MTEEFPVRMYALDISSLADADLYAKADFSSDKNVSELNTFDQILKKVKAAPICKAQ